ncbi:MAG: tRNA (guanosine(37)-N1)-methyltransferase TrmD [Candidatus Omnitrophica bacterium]|nr:tRNA (guanosine(37)-N1)-methyltransferase TrmD [Candidatus Omnitrophota bacterium]
MLIDVVTIFPGIIKAPIQESLLKKAQDKGKVKIRVHDLRKYTHDRHRTVDDKPYGGGAGMLMKPEPFFECLEDIRKKSGPHKKKEPKGWVVLMDPRGRPFNQKTAKRLAGKKRLIFLTGHYEGIDQRVHDHLVDEEISIGDFVTMGGEVPALCVMEAVIRLLPGILGNTESVKDESFQSNMLEYPQYTRPREYRGWTVPEILLSGNHRDVDLWRRHEARKITKKRRPDLLKSQKSKII